MKGVSDKYWELLFYGTGSHAITFCDGMTFFINPSSGLEPLDGLMVQSWA